MSDTPPPLSSILFRSDFPESHFTVQDLRLLGQSWSKSPLRVIALLDFDAFYAQCETVRLGLPDTQPLAVQQWKAIIALNYPARAAGLRRGMPAEDAKIQCPGIVLQHVATWREGDTTWAYREDIEKHMTTDKSALDPYRAESRRIFDLIKDWLPQVPTPRMEKASIDEVYLDLSAQVHSILLQRHPELQPSTMQATGENLPMPPSTLLNWATDEVVDITPLQEEDVTAPDWDDVAICIGAEIVRDLRQYLHHTLRYTCSAGISRNKTLAKMGAGHNKPNKQTVVRTRAVLNFLSTYKVTDIPGLGGKYGTSIEEAFSVTTMADILHVSLPHLRMKLGDASAHRIFNLVRGVEYNDVVSRIQVQSMLSAKTFVPSVQSLAQATRWLRIFAADLMNRLREQDLTSPNRRPRTIAVHHLINGRFGPTRSKQTSIPSGSQLNEDVLFALSKSLLVELTTGQESWPCVTLSVSISNFEDQPEGKQSIASFLLPTGNSYSTKEHTYPALRNSGISSQARTFPDPNARSIHPGDDSKAVGARGRPCKASPRHQSAKLRNRLPFVQSLSSTSEASQCLGSSHDYKCPKCSESLSADNVLEHLDWHFAVDLHNS